MSALLSSSPLIGMNSSNMSLGNIQSLGPGEIVKNSGKFAKPTKIPGKNYSKDEIIIRNSDSGKGKEVILFPYLEKKLVKISNMFNCHYQVMGIKGRRVHIIEEMSNCVISFQRGKIKKIF